MSSSFFVDRTAPADIAAVVRELDRPGLAWADGDLTSLGGEWPEDSLLLYIPGASARGVQVVRDGARFQVRLLAMSSPGDYDLAFRLLEVLGAGAIVEPEDGEPTPVEAVRERFGGAWMERDMAAALTALRAALETGASVTIEGPVNSLELEPAALHATDPTKLYEVLVRAQASAPRPRPRAEEPDEHRALAVVLEGGRVHAFSGETRANMIELLAAGPDGLVERVAPVLEKAERVRYWMHHGWVVDLDRRVVRIYQYASADQPGYVKPDLARWDGFAVSEHDTERALAAYLGALGIGLPPDRDRDADPAWDAIEQELVLGAEEHLAHLRELDAADPYEPPKQRLGTLPGIGIALVFLVVLVPGLLARLLLRPFRDLRHARRERRRGEANRRLRAAIADKTAAMRAADDDLDLRHDRAVLLISGPYRASAERELQACLACYTGRDDKVGMVHHNLAIVRGSLRLHKLAHRSERAAHDAGYKLRIPLHLQLRRAVTLVYVLFAGPFWLVSGVIDD